MMHEDEKDEKLRNREPAHLLLIQRLRSLPRVKPSLSFRLRVFAYTLFPSQAAEAVERRPQPGSRVHGEARLAHRSHSSIGLRVAAYGCLAVLLVLSLFGGLSIAARNSRPGDSLYFLKQARERVELAFTSGEKGKAEKHLSLAEARVQELDDLVANREADQEKVRSFAEEFDSYTRAVQQYLGKVKDPGASEKIASRLKVVTTARDNLVTRLASAQPENVLQPAGGASVTVSDASGTPSLDGGKSAVSGRTDADGRYSFDIASTAAGSGKLEATVEQDGRKQVVPLGGARHQSAAGSIGARVEPSTVDTLVVGRPQQFTLYLTDSSGRGIAGRQMRLRDTSNTSLVNGSPGEIALVTDAGGSCSFIVTKTSIARASRIDLRVPGATPQETGEVLVLGGLESPSCAVPGGFVSARYTGTASQAQQVELDNGLVRVRLSGGGFGTVVSSVDRTSGGVAAGPLTDPAASQLVGTQGIVSRAIGPRLYSSNTELAGYEVEFEMNSNGSLLRRSYRVTLARGDAFAKVEFNSNLSGNPSSFAGGAKLLDVWHLALPQGARIEVAGGSLDTTGLSGTTSLTVNPAAPYFSYKTGGNLSTVVACPGESELKPESWSVTEGSVTLRAPQTLLLGGNGRKIYTLLGVADAEQAEAVQKAAMDVSVPPARVASDTAEGFLVVTRPPADRLKPGSKVTLEVLKQYRKVI